MAEFMIGTTLEGMTNLEALMVPLVPPKSNYLPYARTVNLGSGGKRGVGSPMAFWDFSLMTLEERNQLKEFCPGAAADVYIRTKLNDDTYADFSAKMLWLDNIEDRWFGEKKNMTIQFRNLILIEGS
jgi:hypothetical protein